MTRTEAIKQACNESDMYRQGSDWIVRTWDESCRAWREGPSRTHAVARQNLADWRFQRALELLGLPELLPGDYHGSLRERGAAATAGMRRRRRR